MRERRPTHPGTLLLAFALVAAATYFVTRRFAVEPAAAKARVEKVGVAVRGELVAPAPPDLAERPVKNVILLIGDGMGGSQITVGRTQTRGPAGRLTIERLPVTGIVETWAAGSPVTKSDASATAYATGVKTRNGRIGTDTEARPLRSILETLRDRGFATGLVTTSRITDATPASFAAHVAERSDQVAIAASLAGARVDLLVGGGRRFFQPKRARGERGDGRDLLAEMQGRGVSLISDPAAFQSVRALPAAAIFDADPQQFAGREPSIGELGEKAIELLAASGRPFFALIEDEEIDTQSHANDAERLAAALERFDEAVSHAVEFAARDGATLVLVTGDHSTGGPSIDDSSTPKELVVVWESDDHTGEPIPVFAYGPPQAARLFTGVMDNTELPLRIARALGVDFQPGLL